MLGLYVATPGLSRSDVVRITEKDEQTVGNLLSNTTTAGQLQRKPLHLSPLTHLGFDNLFEESYIIHPDILYRLILRDAIPIARVSLPSPHVPRFKFQSSCSIFNPEHIKCVDYMLGSHSFSKLCAEHPSPFSPTTMLADRPDYPSPATDAAMHCLRTFLKHFNNIFSFFEADEITTVFQHHFDRTQPSRSGGHAAVNMVCACALWMTDDAQNRASEKLFHTALRMLPDVLMEVPDSVSIGALLLMVCSFYHRGAVDTDLVSYPGHLPHINF
ncbi:hypothetical protein N8I77_006823 [Diaporthe amygdali]|uniref:Transcription factor domain-containing protein n=1 Tax=Phomopsis amygdali TaxID=1214568 RepID=A0AAD9W4Z3_PHOAM|nr:hypothetical protein N8I77_006823 [Diaporthe amygdali]